MKASKYESLLKPLSEGYTITSACTKAGVSRMFYNRHRRDNPEFRKKTDEARLLGKQVNDDRVMSAFLRKINDGDSRLIKYYLSSTYLKSFATLQDLLSAYPSRTLSPQC